MRPEVPAIECRDRVRTPVDAFIAAKLESMDLRFSPDAPGETLARRAWLDLLGLPPPLAELDAFLSDETPDAYERLLDRLLGSPRHGERWGRHWLDLAGYADSDGANDADAERPDAWRYRDYVIRSFNADKAHDVFLREQLGGDELAHYPAGEIASGPVDLTPERIELLTATGFLRCAADGTGQGGVDPRIVRNQVVADTLAILGTGVLGLTIGCAQCHDHRYDPIAQKDYHRLRAALEPAYDVEQWKAPASRRVSLYTEADRTKAAEVAALVSSKRAERNAMQAGFVRAVVEKLCEEKLPEAERTEARTAFDTPADKRTPEQKALFEKHPFLKISGGTLYQYDPEADKKVKAMDSEIEKLAATRPPEGFVSALWEEPGRVPPSRLLIRGQPDQPAEEVAAGVPAVLVRPGESHDLTGETGGLPTSGRRLRLARWLTSPENPLTARVFVNRVWMHHFGTGLVPTPGDFGRQGDAPTHPELLDWLADDFVRGGFSVKRLHRLILTSTVYRQSAVKSKDGEARDPDNELYWRRPVLRLEGESIRDAILAVSGTLSLRTGGPAVPVKEDADGSIVVGVDRKVDSNRPGPEVPMGDEAFRRSVYVEVRRTRPLSFTSTFDTPVMETNCTQRPVSIIAPQALTLLNGPFVREQADFFARRLLREAADDPARIDLAFRHAFSREPTAGEKAGALEYLKAEVEALATSDAAVATPEPGRIALARLCHVLFNASELLFVE
ncbi:MAG TPA: DUF1549 and DUF1553 domain-containing protein, partial [Planctomycetota bacterium]|nr:DUF1549 and DUF1553 domain-containing protein [Planctomycetota bacterium]